GFLAFNLSTNGDTAKPHPLFGDRLLRRALAMGVDREGLRQSVWGDLAQVPPGPLVRSWSIWDPETRDLPYDTAQAGRSLTRLGWRDSNGDGRRAFQRRPLRQPRVRSAGGRGDRRTAARRGEAAVAPRDRDAQPGCPGNLPLRTRQRGRGESPGDGRRHPAGRVLGAGAHLAHPRRPADRS